MSASTFDTLVIGGGWSGLIATLRLSQAGRRVLLLEARERLGGRAFTHSFTPSTGLRDDRVTAPSREGEQVWNVDFGCSWVHGFREGNPVKELAESFGIPVHVPRPTKTAIIGPEGVLPEALAQKLQANLGAAQASASSKARIAGRSPPPLTSSLASHLFAADSPLYGELSQSQRGLATSLARSLHVPLGAPLEKISLRWTGHETAFGGTDGAPEGGFSVLIARVASEATRLGAQIRTGCTVRKVSLLEKGSAASVQVDAEVAQEGSQTQEQFNARSILCTIPLAVLKENTGIFEPSLEDRRLATIERTHVGTLNKVLLTYPTAWWPEDTGTFFLLAQGDELPSSPQALEALPLADLLSRTTLIVSSLSAPNGLPGPSTSLLTYVGAPAAACIEKHTRADVANALHNLIASRLGQNINDVPEPNHTFYSRWLRQPLTRGATTTPVVVPTSGNDQDAPSPLDFRQLGQPTWDGLLGFAGEHTDMDHRGSVAGAFVSGEREAARIERLLGSKASL